MKKLGLFLFITMSIVIIIPGVITLFFGTDATYNLTVPITQNPGYDSGSKVTVYNPAVGEESVMNLEDYITGVVAAEVPAGFNEEALKAQAVAARTYAYRRIKDGRISGDKITQDDIKSIDQAYFSVDELKERWGDNFDEYYSKISSAVKSTKGEIMIYEDIPIEAVFHSTSAGVTEDAENVWDKEYPYLKSVDSGEDMLSPEYTSEMVFSNKEVLDKLRESFSGLYLSDGSFSSQFQIIERSDAGYVEKVQVGNTTLTGRQIREALGLKSTYFTVNQEGDTVKFLTKGYGHGVGMSQYGANIMADNGSGYREILEHYYTGVVISTID